MSLTTPAGLLIALPRVTLDRNRVFDVRALCRPVGRRSRTDCCNQSATSADRAMHLVASRAGCKPNDWIWRTMARRSGIPPRTRDFYVFAESNGNIICIYIYMTHSRRSGRSIDLSGRRSCELRSRTRTRMRSLADASVECRRVESAQNNDAMIFHVRISDGP